MVALHTLEEEADVEAKAEGAVDLAGEELWAGVAKVEVVGAVVDVEMD